MEKVKEEADIVDNAKWSMAKIPLETLCLIAQGVFTKQVKLIVKNHATRLSQEKIKRDIVAVRQELFPVSFARNGNLSLHMAIVIHQM